MRLIRLSLFFLIAVVSVLAVSCSKPASENNMGAREKYIMCTTEIIEDVVSLIAGGAFEVHALIRGNMDPHSYELVKGELEKLEGAEAVFANGLGLEHGSSLAYFLHKSDKVISLGEYVLQEKPEDFIKIEGSIDPHFWMDVELFSHVIDPITDKLSQLCPDKQSDFNRRAERLKAEFKQLDHDCLAQISDVPMKDRYLVTSHDAFNYFVRRYLAEGQTGWQDRVMAPQGLAPEAEISLFDLKKVCDFMIERKVGVLFTEQNVSTQAHRKLQEICGKRGHVTRLAKAPLFGDTLDKKHEQASSYFGMVRYNTEQIAKELTDKEGS